MSQQDRAQRLATTAGAALLLGACALALAASAESPLTEKDVVRMFVSGVPEATLLEHIARRAPAYDLSPEMLEELRLAGIPRSLVEAMQARQPVAAAGDADEAADDDEAAVVVHLASSARAGQPVQLRVDAEVPASLAQQWDLPPDDEGRTVTDIAVFLACTTPDHVPDQWRAASPLGRDFSVPRHGMLGFVSGAETARGERLVFEVGRLEARAAVGTHDLLVGLALHVGGRYRALRADTLESVLVGADGIELNAEVRPGPKFSAVPAGIEFVRSIPAAPKAD